MMMLVNDGQLTLEDSISRWFPETGDVWKSIKVRHLMSHTSGLGRPPYDTIDLKGEYSEDDWVKLMSARPALSPPGVVGSYNNGGYILLGVLVHRLSGVFYGDLLQDLIFRPLDMRTARVISERDIVENRAAGYVMTDTGLKN